MAKTVNSAFQQFMTDYVNLEQDQVATARKSRNWLVTQLNNLPSKYDDFPALYEEKHKGFGSFARSTKKRNLDDIDHLVCMSANGVTYTEIGDTIFMHVPDQCKPFNGLLQTDGTFLSSIRVVNRFVKYLNDIPQYQRADIKRNQEAATLKLTSHPWNFDIVPCFFTAPNSQGQTFYIIPDGKGNWKKTDPRKDQERTTRVNQLRDGKVLQAIRLMKYWNARPTMPSMGSYLLENMILDYYEQCTASQWLDFEAKYLLAHIRDSIFNEVQDPKGIQGNINNLDFDERFAIYNRAKKDYDSAVEAYNNETSNPNYAISKWRSIFGTNFPSYG
ncbi:hypothetical protein LL295_22635 [Vibrio campbellii]|uniref:hypothetical protein n=1 Tax=Vibrio campbellii TaxID=680 RepID=UPI001D17844C|nr:hypothetical protein [Vibrio campbellii]MCC4226288.1 hypothetical protein [Vibrio campbellii]